MYIDSVPEDIGKEHREELAARSSQLETGRGAVRLALYRAAYGAAVSAPLNSPPARCADLGEFVSAHLNGVELHSLCSLAGSAASGGRKEFR